MKDEMLKIALEGISAEELADAKTYTIGRFALSLNSNRRLARTLVALQISDLGIDYIERRADYINAVTPTDIIRVARRMFLGNADGAPDEIRLVTAIVGDPEGF